MYAWRCVMRTTLNLPITLISEAMKLTKCSTKTEVIVYALKELIQKESIQELKKYKGKVVLDIDLGNLRNR
jgi:hypothetical protein